MPESNLDQLIRAARLLDPLLTELVFVGGAVTSVLVNDPGAGPPRPTIDVDVVAEITSYREYTKLGERLRELGFWEDKSEGAPVCRWLQAGTVLDLMPLDAGVLGFSNRWCPEAMKTSMVYPLRPGLTIQVINAPHFLATKLEAFKDRGGGSCWGSHDLEDLLYVVDGRASIADEVRRENQVLRDFLRFEITQLLAGGLIDALPDYLLPDAASQARSGMILRRLKEMTAP